ncbi:DUF1206 domain-containing protein [Agromyces aurantiacus]|uniref:DUF1206 domain-containing protein n=1 Tax=Agromyces aurantiacus TaxID=165814 RepID=A0ABV9R7M1_9MICO|nr:DUF1206 domain-containing protein [Agromyces aurantiacus]MBM7504349.1 lysylphosphatidylglycerol synthetase-like protein (DUF2156 family) [Agromyces aurantiacus]
MTSATGKSAASAAQSSRVLETLARIGFVVLGIVHIVIGAIAISVAQGAGGEADQSGAMGQVASWPFGVVLLWVIAIGLFALGVWQVAEAFLVRESDTKKKWGYRVKYVGTAIAYISIGVTALVYALGGRSNPDQSSETLSAKLLAAPGGVFLLVLIGLIILGVGVAFVYRGATQAFEKRLLLPGNEPARKGIVTFGTVGYIAKGVAVAIVGVLFVIAAVTSDPKQAGGLDAALKSLAGLPFGVFILWLIGAGLIVYGIFCFARARYAKM